MHIVITGASRGIGLEFVRQYLARGASVVAAARTPEALRPLRERFGQRLLVQRVDVDSDEDARALAAAVAAPVDVLINNAGVMGHAGALPELDLADMRRTYEVNALGPLRVTRALLPRLRQGAGKKVVHITSKMGSITDNRSGGYYGYRMSKAALNMASACLAHELHPERILSAVLNPGWVQTDMGGAGATLLVEDSVAEMVRVIDGLTLAHSGGFFHYNGEPIPW